VRTHFGHASKKNELVCHGRSWSSVAGRGSSPERVKRGKEEGRGGGAQLGGGMGSS
jgi:hypothetical protein